MSKRVFITGSAGFTGKYVCDEFRRAGWEVWGAGLQPKPDDAQYLQIDLLEPDTLKPIADKIKPDVVIHLAAIAFVAEKDPNIFYQVNLMGTRNLLEVLANAKRPPDCTILASSANVYGNSHLEMLSEGSPVNPANDYAVSKLAMEHMARTFMARLPIIVTLPFNYPGVGQSKEFLIPKIVTHFSLKKRLIQLGNINVERDFLDVRDVAAFYLAIAQKPLAGETFNLCSGNTFSLSDILKEAERITGHILRIEVNPDYVRMNEIKRLAGDPKKLYSQISHRPNFDIKATIWWMIQAVNSAS